MVDRDRVPIVFLRSIKYLAILFPWFDEDVLWCDEAVWDKAPEPVRYMEDIIVMFFFVHGGHDLGRALAHVAEALKWFGQPTVMTLVYWVINDSSNPRHLS